MTETRSPTIPLDSLVFGYGPMLPFVAGAIGAWAVPGLAGAAIGLTIIWASLIMAFVGGVRRGFGFGNAEASLASELVTMAVYVTIAGLALIAGWRGATWQAAALLMVGFVIVPIADARAARAGNAPAYFAPLRPRQMAIAALSMAAILARLLIR